MRVRLWIGAVTILGIAVPGAVRADHSHHHEATAASDASVSASLGFVAAQYSTTSFVGDYQGVTPGLQWASSRFAAAANVGAYRLRKNGALYHGIGDPVVSGQAAVVGHHARSAGVALALSVPMGSQRDGLGMGHVMVMPAVWGSWSHGDATVALSGGYGRALGASDGGGHVHGTGPIVDPMNLQEVTWSAGGELAVARALRLGARLEGALALGDSGQHRAIGAARAVWTEGRVDTSAELQLGITGDPFNVRGVITTAMRF